jgi:ribose transport system substrate-binding protein
MEPVKSILLRRFRAWTISALTAAVAIGAPHVAAQESAQDVIARASAPLTAKPAVPSVQVGEKLKGKSIYYISAGLSFPFSQQVLKGVTDASQVLGMAVTVADAAGDSSKASNHIDRAVGQSASAIILQGVDPYTIKASIGDAKKAGIPVVSVAALTAGPVPGELAAAGVVAAVQFSFSEAGKVLAAYIAANAETNDAHVGLIGSSTFRTDQDFVSTFTNELRRLCPKCQVVHKDAPLMQWQTNLPSLIRTMITVDPSLDYIVPVVDAMVPAVKPAIAAAGASDRIKIVTANASLPNMQAIAKKSDPEVANVGSSNERMGWAAVDQIARILTGQDPVVEAQPARLFTSGNIGGIDLKQPAGEWYGFDFATFYRKLWGL